jgi:hypothetical protein
MHIAIGDVHLSFGRVVSKLRNGIRRALWATRASTVLDRTVASR